MTSSSSRVTVWSVARRHTLYDTHTHTLAVSLNMCLDMLGTHWKRRMYSCKRSRIHSTYSVYVSMNAAHAMRDSPSQHRPAASYTLSPLNHTLTWCRAQRGHRAPERLRYVSCERGVWHGPGCKYVCVGEGVGEPVLGGERDVWGKLDVDLHTHTYTRIHTHMYRWQTYMYTHMSTHARHMCTLEYRCMHNTHMGACMLRLTDTCARLVSPCPFSACVVESTCRREVCMVPVCLAPDALS